MQRVKQAVGPARWTAALAVVFMAQAAAASDAGLQHVAAHVAVDQNDDPDVVEVYLTAREKMVQLGGGRPTAMRTYNGKVPGPTIEG